MIFIIISYQGAEWWAQQFGKSIPFLSWVPFLNGKNLQTFGFGFPPFFLLTSLFYAIGTFLWFFRDSNVQSSTIHDDCFRCYTNRCNEVSLPQLTGLMVISKLRKLLSFFLYALHCSHTRVVLHSTACLMFTKLYSHEKEACF